MNNYKTYFLVLQFLFLVSCTIFEEPNRTLTVKGVIVDKFTNIPTPNIKVLYDSCEPYGGVMFGGCNEIDQGFFYTDSKGEFSIPIYYKNLSDEANFYIVENEEYYASGTQMSFKVLTLKDKPLKFLTVKYAKTIIKIKNINPFDNNDVFEIVWFGAKNDLEQILFVKDKVIDFGNSKEEGVYYIWKGEDVESNLIGKIKSGYNVFFKYRVTKNGVTSSYESETKMLDPNTENEFLIEY